MVRLDIIRALTEFFGRWDHPILMAILAFALTLQLLGFLVELWTDPRPLSGFLMVFAILFATVGLIGYTLVFGFRAFLKIDRKYGLTT